MDEKARELRLEPAVCKSCGRRVLWGKSKEGKDVILSNRVLQVYVVRTRADGRPDGSGIVEYRKAFESHFADCPNAQAHRSKPS